MAAVLACGLEAAVSHRSAAAMWGLLPAGGESAPIDITVAGRDRGRRRGIRAHRVSQLAPSEVTRIDAIPVTTVSRTLLDLAAVVQPRELEQAIAQAERRQLISRAAMAALVAGRSGRLLAVATALTFGTAPALRATSAVYDAVREGGRGTETVRQRRVWSLLVGAEVALALLLLVGSGLLIRSFYELTRVDPGFEIERQLTVQVSLPASRYDDGAERTEFYDRLLASVRALPGVQEAAITMTVPLVDFDPNGMFDIEGGEIGDGDASYRVVSDDFFETMGTPILRGRGFTAADRAGAEDVIIINDRLAREFFTDTDPIGKRMRTGGMDARGLDFARIVGVVGDVRTRGLHLPSAPGYYLAYPQRTGRLLNATLVVRAAGNPEPLSRPVRDAIHAIDTDVAMEVSTLEADIGASIADRRFMLYVLGAFAATALLLSGVGIYGVVSFAVAERTREIGIRMALGAASASVLWSVSRSTMLSVAAGVVVGLLGAAWLSRLIASLLYDISPLDPLTFAAVALLLLATAWVAVLVPARRAVSVSPLVSLRAE
ncbi:MAG TPA: FtsX-like permease family protein [Longimicrobiales bacterium]|nr:FtsX-like permease family protein [Longimicrobiales bacterium]